MLQKYMFCYRECCLTLTYKNISESLHHPRKEQSRLHERLRNDCVAVSAELKSEICHTRGNFDGTISPRWTENRHDSNADVCINLSAQSLPQPDSLMRCLNFKGFKVSWMMNATIDDAFIYEGRLPPEPTVCVSRLF